MGGLSARLTGESGRRSKAVLKSGLLFTSGVFLSLVIGCVTTTPEPADGVQLLGSTFGLAAKLEKPVLHVCMNTNHPMAFLAVKRAVLEWVSAFDNVPSRGFIKDVAVACPGDFQVNFFSRSRAHTFPSQYPVLNVGSPADYSIILHEVGHAFGLGDGYVEGIWRCDGIHSDSVMCDIRRVELSAADKEGIREVWSKYKSRPVFRWNGRNYQCPDKMVLYGIGSWIFCSRSR